MVLTLAPFSGVNVASKIALWEMRAKTQDSPAPTRAAKRLETSRIASFEHESPSGSEAASPSSFCSLPSLSPHSSGSPPPSPAIGEICHARIWYYVAETQACSPSVELAGIPLSVELAEFPPSVELPTVSLVSKPKTSSESSEFKEPSLPFETLTLAPSSDCSTSPSSSFTTSAPFSESAASSPSPSSATFSVSTETSELLDELAALDLEGIKHVLDFPVAAPLSGLLWRQ
ncbi:hypothetical protein K525DRAFT_274400 [Schizophyllum commune Loenen D]|nr:hypothetical protein K525DRAFT_274400 [Schizophyllum commune Loenen D]